MGPALLQQAAVYSLTSRNTGTECSLPSMIASQVQAVVLCSTAL